MNELIGEDSATFIVKAGSSSLTEAEKIDALIAKVESMTDAAFIRSGDGHTPADAAEHLRRKVDSADDRIKTAEEFMEQIASTSSLADYLDLVVREHYQMYAESLSKQQWEQFIKDCRGRDPEMPEWSDSTIGRLRSSVFQILAEAGFISDTRTAKLQSVHIARPVLALPRKP